MGSQHAPARDLGNGIIADSFAGVQPPLRSSSGPHVGIDIARWSLTGDSAADVEKLSAARYALGDTEDEFASDSSSEDFRIKWKLNKIKMRVSLDTSNLQ